MLSAYYVHTEMKQGNKALFLPIPGHFFEILTARLAAERQIGRLVRATNSPARTSSRIFQGWRTAALTLYAFGR